MERFGPLPETVARRVAAQLMGALAHMHKRGFLHGNLRPAAVLFEANALHNATLRLGGVPPFPCPHPPPSPARSNP